MNVEVFVQNIKYYCAKKGVKPTNACKESGVGASFISDINRGQTPSVAKVQMLADYLGVTTSELLGEKMPATGEGDGPSRNQISAKGLGIDSALQLAKFYQAFQFGHGKGLLRWSCPRP